MNHGEELKNMVALIALCGARIVATLLVLPATSGQKLQGMSRAALPVWMGLYIAWGQPLDVIADLNTPMLAVLILKETLIGFLIGFAAATIFWVAEGVGSMIDNLAGYNNVQQSNPNSSDQSTPVGSFLSELSIYSFYALGGMVALLGTLFESYKWWPLTATLPNTANLLEVFAREQVMTYMTTVARLAAPALLTLLLIDLGFGLLTKTAEKLEPNSLAQPVKGAVTMVLLSLIIAVFFQQVRAELSLSDLARHLQAMWGPR
ncbi:type III secretion system export apparatus subunit SctT [Ideonella sp. DXS29W]|uniref:Type III secretion system export apparatus subunit SctT n=1 Tax=Ideonella lacteola TaxID=2984193 RepID=A0ABU9BKH5_9BURK